MRYTAPEVTLSLRVLGKPFNFIKEGGAMEVFPKTIILIVKYIYMMLYLLLTITQMKLRLRNVHENTTDV